MIFAHRGVGLDDPDLQATFNDPVHLTIPPGSWEEMERLENERQAKLSSSSAEPLLPKGCRDRLLLYS
jgi:hypothetical protein